MNYHGGRPNIDEKKLSRPANQGDPPHAAILEEKIHNR